MAVAVVMSKGRAKVVQNSPKPEATTGSVAETIEVFYGAGTVVSLYDFIPCWTYDYGTGQYVSRSCTFIEGEYFTIAAHIVQNTGDVKGYVYFDLCYYDEDAATWVSLVEEMGCSSPVRTDYEVDPDNYAVLYYSEETGACSAVESDNPSTYGVVVIVPGKYRTYELGKTHYFGFKAWGEDEEEPTLPTPV